MLDGLLLSLQYDASTGICFEKFDVPLQRGDAQKRLILVYVHDHGL